MMPQLLKLTEGTLNERWYDFWMTGVLPSINVNTPELVLTTGKQGQNFGFKIGSYGSIDPTVLKDGNDIQRFTVNNANGRVEFQVEGVYPQDEFNALEIIGIDAGVFLQEEADYNSNPLRTRWRWDNSNALLEDATVYAVEFA